MLVNIPADTVHAYENLVDGTTLIGIVSDAKGGELFTSIDREVKSLPEDLPKVIEVGQRYGVEFVNGHAETRVRQQHAGASAPGNPRYHFARHG